MTTLITAPNIQSALTLRSTGYNEALQRYEIVYRITRHTVEPRTPVDFKDEKIYLRNAPAQHDDEGNEIQPANWQLDIFTASFSSFAEMRERSIEMAMAHAQHAGTFVPYVDEDAEIWAQKLIDEGEPSPDWVRGEIMLPGYVRTYNGTKKRNLYRHLSSNDITPDNSAIWVNPGEQATGLMTKIKNLFS